jgi:ubiquinol-cytochrome c reductase cytochrome b subunit
VNYVRTNGTTAARVRKATVLGGVMGWIDDRTGIAGTGRKLIRKVFPDHWSFLLGEIALWSFVILLLTGVLLTMWFKPSMAEVIYTGSYNQLRGIPMSEAYASTLDISFDVRGGLLVRQIHHWAAMLFIAAMLVHMMRHFLTGAFRKPRELNWMIGFALLILGTLEGFAGYSLPDDLLSGTGLRIADGLITAIPVVGTYVSFFLFGGEFPCDAIIPRLYVVHVLLIPAVLLALVGAHLLLLVYYKHTQWPGPGRTPENVVGYPFLPVYAAKTGGFFFIVFGITALMGGLLSINPLWKYGPYNPAEVTAGSQPDWYMGFLEGLLRIMPGWESEIFGATVSWSSLVPGVVAPGLIVFVLLTYPFLEAWITGDNREHHLLQRPRNAPTRTAFLVSMITLYGLLWAAGGNDILALVFELNLTNITHFMRVAVFIGPVIAFLVTRRWCISLQRAADDQLLHGYETGVLVRTPEGCYSENHLPLPDPVSYSITGGGRDPLLPPPSDANDHHIVGRRGLRKRLRAKLSSFYFAGNLQMPSREQLQLSRWNAAVDATSSLGRQPQPDDARVDDAVDPTSFPARPHRPDDTRSSDRSEGKAADGHQFDGRHQVQGQPLRRPR